MPFIHQGMCRRARTECIFSSPSSSEKNQSSSNKNVSEGKVSWCGFWEDKRIGESPKCVKNRTGNVPSSLGGWDRIGSIGGTKSQSGIERNISIKRSRQDYQIISRQKRFEMSPCYSPLLLTSVPNRIRSCLKQRLHKSHQQLSCMGTVWMTRRNYTL